MGIQELGDAWSGTIAPARCCTFRPPGPFVFDTKSIRAYISINDLGRRCGIVLPWNRVTE